MTNFTAATIKTHNLTKRVNSYYTGRLTQQIGNGSLFAMPVFSTRHVSSFEWKCVVSASSTCDRSAYLLYDIAHYAPY